MIECLAIVGAGWLFVSVIAALAFGRMAHMMSEDGEYMRRK